MLLGGKRRGPLAVQGRKVGKVGVDRAVVLNKPRRERGREGTRTITLRKGEELGVRRKRRVKDPKKQVSFNKARRAEAFRMKPQAKLSERCSYTSSSLGSTPQGGPGAGVAGVGV